MSVDVKVSLNGYVDIKEIVDFLNEIGNVENYKVNEKNYEKQCENLWKEIFCEDKLWKFKFGFITFYYKKEFRTLFYNYSTVNFWNDIECYSEELQKNFVKGEHTQLNISYYGNAVEIMKLICAHFGGWIDENDCDDIDPYYIEKKSTNKYAYSFDDEFYTGTFGSVEEAFKEAVIVNNKNYTEVYIGKCIKPALGFVVNEEYIIDSMYDSLADQVGDAAESFEVSDEEQDELEKRLEFCVEKWIKDMHIEPNCFAVEDVKTYSIGG